MKKFLLLSLCGLFACALASKPPAPYSAPSPPSWEPRNHWYEVNVCVSRNASYVFHRHEIVDLERGSTASCGPIEDTVITVDSTGRVISKDASSHDECSVGPTAHVEGCKVFTDLTCRDELTTRMYHGWITWESDGSRGKGLTTVTQRRIRTSLECRSTYVVFATRI